MGWCIVMVDARKKLVKRLDATKALGFETKTGVIKYEAKGILTPVRIGSAREVYYDRYEVEALAEKRGVLHKCNEYLDAPIKEDKKKKISKTPNLNKEPHYEDTIEPVDFFKEIERIREEFYSRTVDERQAAQMLGFEAHQCYQVRELLKKGQLEYATHPVEIRTKYGDRIDQAIPEKRFDRDKVKQLRLYLLETEAKAIVRENRLASNEKEESSVVNELVKQFFAMAKGK